MTIGGARIVSQDSIGNAWHYKDDDYRVGSFADDPGALFIQSSAVVACSMSSVHNFDLASWWYLQHLKIHDPTPARLFN
jgi:hypothetical protein